MNLCFACHVISTSIREDILATNTLTNVLLKSKNLLPTPSELEDRGQATINPAIKAILRMSTLKTLRQLSSFLGQLAYIGRFIVNLPGKAKPFSKWIKKGVPYAGGKDCQRAFEEIKGT